MSLHGRPRPFTETALDVIVDLKQCLGERRPPDTTRLIAILSQREGSFSLPDLVEIRNLLLSSVVQREDGRHPVSGVPAAWGGYLDMGVTQSLWRAVTTAHRIIEERERALKLSAGTPPPDGAMPGGHREVDE